jgi:nitroreductase
MTLEEAIRGRRSIRSYRDQEIAESLLMELLDLARHAPSSMDAQPWRFVLIREARLKHQLAAIKNAYCPAEKQAYRADFIAAAPVIVAVCVERSRSWGRELENGVLATASLLLAAHACGLGSVYLSAYQSDQPGLALEIRRLLRLPDDVEPVTLVPLGFPADPPRPKVLRPLQEMIRHE